MKRYRFKVRNLRWHLPLIASCAIVFSLLMPVSAFSEYVGCTPKSAPPCASEVALPASCPAHHPAQGACDPNAVYTFPCDCDKITLCAGWYSSYVIAGYASNGRGGIYIYAVNRPSSTWQCNNVTFDCNTCVGTSSGVVNTGVPGSEPSPEATTICGGRCSTGGGLPGAGGGSQGGAGGDACGNGKCGSDCSSNIPLDSSANPGSGNLYHDQTLFQTNTLGFTLSYNSIDNYSGPLGKGWTHNWNIFLFSNPSDNSIGLKQGDGRIVYFKLNNGIYYPEAQSGEDSYITYTSDTYTLIEKNGTTYNFNASTGKLISIKDRNGNTTSLSYAGANLTSITDPSGRTIYLTYDSQNRINAITDLNGNTYTFTYTNGTLVSLSFPLVGSATGESAGVENPSGWSYSYDADGRMKTKTDPQGYVTTYAYDSDGKVVSSQDPEGRIKSLSYDPQSNTVTLTEKDGGIWTYKYDPLLNVTIQKTDPQGNVTTSQYDQNKNLIVTTEPDGGITNYTYDEYGNMASVTDTAGNTTSYTYNEFGQTTSVTDSENKITTYAYDANGNLLSITDPSGATSQYTYDARGNVISVINANGQTTSFIYDSYNNLSSVTDSAGAITAFIYDTAGNMTSQTDPQGNVTRFEYSSLNQLIKITDSQGNITTYTYDANGNRTSVTNPNGKTTYYEFNYKGQLLKETDSGGDVIIYGYGNTGCASCGGGSDKLTSITDSKGRVTSYVYDSIGRLIKITDPINGEIAYAYDSIGRLTSVTDSIGNTTRYEYDSLGRVIKTNSPDTGLTTYTYNSVGNVLTKTDANGIMTAYAYDALNRLLQIQFPDSSENITYTYDTCINGIGKLCTMIDPSGTTAYAYDILGRLTKETNTVLGIAYTTTYDYDKTGKLTTITYPSGRKVSYTYNTVYRPTSVSQQMNKGTKTIANNFNYDKIGNPLSMTLGNGLTQQWAYDQKNRISTIYVPNILNLNYSYDPIGNITAITDNLEPFKSKTYDYDPVDRLVAATGPWGNLAWTYDANGNRLSQTNGKTTTYTYEVNRLTSVSNGGVNNYQYDNNGNTLSNGKLNFIYNQNNRLMKAVADGKVIGEYTYNGKGQRIIKKTKSGDSDDEGDDDGEYDHHIVFHYDLSGRLIEETKADGKLIADYIYLNGSPFAMIRKQHHKEETFYYHNDHLGTPKVLTDKLKKIVWDVEFDPFGNELHKHGRQGTYIRKVKNNLRFTGQYNDKETNTHYNGKRTYLPSGGRYLEADPIGIQEGNNHLYLYANANPIRFTDPLGLTVKLCKRDLNILCDPTHIGCGGSSTAGSRLHHAFISVNGETFGHTTNRAKPSLRCIVKGPGYIDHNLGIDKMAELEGYMHGSCQEVKCENEQNLLSNLKGDVRLGRAPYYCLTGGTNCQEWANMKLEKYCKCR